MYEMNSILIVGFLVCMLIIIVLLAVLIGMVRSRSTGEAVKTKQPERRSEAVDRTIAQIVENEKLADDLELVAVITAAIAASMGPESREGFVVRSIRRARTSRW